MEDNKILKKLTTIIIISIGVDEKDIQPDSLLSELGADSLDLIEIVMGVEKEFGITIPDSEIYEIKKITVQDIVNMINKHICK